MASALARSARPLACASSRRPELRAQLLQNGGAAHSIFSMKALLFGTARRRRSSSQTAALPPQIQSASNVVLEVAQQAAATIQRSQLQEDVPYLGPNVYTFNRPLLIAISLPLVLGSLAGARTFRQVMTWYRTLDKPWWTPPDALFGQFWVLLYALQGYASYRVWLLTGWPSWPLAFYALQLGLNLAWQIIFFQKERPGLALADNLGLLAAASYTTYLFWREDPAAGQLLLPYLGFLTFANALNFSIWRRQR